MRILMFSMTAYTEEIAARLRAENPGAEVRIIRKEDVLGGGLRSAFAALRKETGYSAFVLAHNTCAYVNKKLFLDWFMRLASRRPVRVLDKDGGTYAITYPRLLASTLPRLAMEAILGGGAILKTKWILRGSAARRARMPIDPAAKSVGYLRTSSWFGVKAGGSVGHTTGVLNGFLALGYKVKVWSSDRLEGISEEKHGLTVIPHSPFVNAFISVTAFAFTFRFYRMALKPLREMAPALLYQRYSLGNFSGVLLARKLALPLVLEYNGSETWMLRNWEKRLPFMDLLERIELFNLMQADRIEVVSDASRDELLARGVPAEAIVTVPNGVDVDIYGDTEAPESKAALKERLGIPADAIVVGFIGTFGKWHGVEFLAEAIKPAVERSGRKLHFLLIGDGPLMPRVREILARDGTAAHATLTGLVPQKSGPAYLGICDLFLSPHVPNPDGSPFFGSPTKLFEYMAMGKGILASDLEQIGEILSPSLRAADLRGGGSPAIGGELAVLHVPGDREDFVAGLLYLAGRADAIAALGANARGEACRKYTWTAHVDAILRGRSH